MLQKVFAAGGVSNPLTPGYSFGGLITGFIGFLIVLAFIASLLYFLWGGLQWITSGGAPEAVEQARSRMIQALIGLILVVMAWAIMGVVQAFFGITFTSLPFPRLGEQCPAECLSFQQCVDSGCTNCIPDASICGKCAGNIDYVCK